MPGFAAVAATVVLPCKYAAGEAEDEGCRLKKPKTQDAATERKQKTHQAPLPSTSMEADRYGTIQQGKLAECVFK